MDRVKTGITGFDELIQGGFPSGFNVLLVGLPGTGKTIFGLQYIYNGAMDDQPGVYVSMDATDGKVREQAGQFGWDINQLESDKKLSILKVPLDRERVRLFDLIQEEVDRIGAKRLVFDSLAAFAINIDQFAIPLAFDDEIDRVLGKSNTMSASMLYEGGSQKRITYLTINKLSNLGTTNLILTDQASEGSDLTVDGVSEYVSDGLIRSTLASVGQTTNRTIQVLKMRNTKINAIKHNFDFGKTGIEIEE